MRLRVDVLEGDGAQEPAHRGLTHRREAGMGRRRVRAAVLHRRRDRDAGREAVPHEPPDPLDERVAQRRTASPPASAASAWIVPVRLPGMARATAGIASGSAAHDDRDRAEVLVEQLGRRR